MKATISIENIEIYGKIRTHWVAKITGVTPNNKLFRDFLKCNIDYSRANSKGTRGIYSWYLLESGSFYEVYLPLNWSKNERYFCKVMDDGKIIKVLEGKVKEWFTKNENI